MRDRTSSTVNGTGLMKQLVKIMATKVANPPTISLVMTHDPLSVGFGLLTTPLPSVPIR